MMRSVMRAHALQHNKKSRTHVVVVLAEDAVARRASYPRKKFATSRRKRPFRRCEALHATRLTHKRTSLNIRMPSCYGVAGAAVARAARQRFARVVSAVGDG